MNPLKLAIAVVAAGLFASTGTVAFSQSYTYVFAATPNPDDPFVSVLNESTITIQNGTIIDWALIDTEFGAVSTPADSSVISDTISSYNAATWNGSFRIGFIPLTLDNTEYPYCYFQGDNSAGGGDLCFYLTEDFDELDPPGTWTGVPDARNSLQLFVLALAGLAAAQLFFRRPVAVLARN